MLPGVVLNRFSKTFLFSFFLFISYLILFLASKRFNFPLIWDEVRFWQVSLSFSHQLLPDLSQLKNYSELNTPLPFIIFGVIEYLFKQGVAAGRLFNFVLSFILVFLIGVPIHRRLQVGLLSMMGLLVFPYYLWLSMHLYTDIIAVFFVFFGVWFYLHNRHIPSSLSFILAIASRQFMLAFPIAIILYEIASSLQSKSFTKLRLQPLLRALAPILAAATILGWVWLFQGLAPVAGIAKYSTPEVQQSIFNIDPASSLYFLACLGLYFVIPEWILFSRKLNPKALFTRKNGYIAIGLLLLSIWFPLEYSHGILTKLSNILPLFSVRAIHYGLAVLACIRFSQVNFTFWLVLANCLLMLKAFPWDKYTLPLITVLWYLKSMNWIDRKAALFAALPNPSRNRRADENSMTT